ncbi:hypothetical protein INR49_017225, partial [Caranx melampygus]
MWHWSQPGKVYSKNTANWNQGEPNDWGGYENCVRIRNDKKWVDDYCSHNHRFICYDESSSENIHWIREAKPWTEAQSYCREHHTDLVSGDQLEGLETGGVTQNDIEWIGLFIDAWAWSDGSNDSFRNWEKFQNGETNNRCAYLKESGKWDSADCSERRSFFCCEGQCSFSTCHRYEYHFINEYKTWEEAQSYCREKYTDLAKVYDMTDMKRLKSSAGSSTGAWIGLKSKGRERRMWHWSQPGKVYKSSSENIHWIREAKPWTEAQSYCREHHTDLVSGDQLEGLETESSSENIHWIDETKTWTDAQSYCREHHTDLEGGALLLTIKQLPLCNKRSVSKRGGTRMWHWSQPGKVYSENTTKWDQGEPNDFGGYENCVRIHKNKKWVDDYCTKPYSFICYDREHTESSSEDIHWIDEAKTWTEAQSYCREHHTDLVSGDQSEGLAGGEDAEQYTIWWIGLFRDAWAWSDGSNSSFRHWESFQSGQEQNKCAYLKESGKWGSDYCSKRRSFVCYEVIISTIFSPHLLHSPHNFPHLRPGWTVFLIKGGQCSFSTCQYHFINKYKTWEEAQSYCREKYTDLAKVYDMSDMKRLKTSAGSSAEAWIGLKSKQGGTKMWHSSQPGKVYSENTANWRQGEPNDEGGYENCVRMHEDKKWVDVGCTQRHRFICYDESSSENIHWINNFKTWTEAQSYCRENHTDLVSGDQLEGLDTGGVTQSDIIWWIGLFRDVWAWSDGSNSSFRHWENFQSGQDQNRCAYLKESGKWDSADCSERRSFVCYEENMILIQQNLTWDQAVRYCRKHHHDLVSITDPEQQRQVAQKVGKATTPYVWLGLRYSCPLDWWVWVSNKLVCYHNWAKGTEPDQCSHRAAIERGGAHEWSKRNEADLYNFICVLQKKVDPSQTHSAQFCLDTELKLVYFNIQIKHKVRQFQLHVPNNLKHFSSRRGLKRRLHPQDRLRLVRPSSHSVHHFSSDRAKMQWGLFLLLLMGQCSLSTCHRYEYHFINERMTWEEAQSYCREKYTDLAKVYDMTDMKRLKNSARSSAEAWIGLKTKGGDEKKWHWSQPGEVNSENREKWKLNPPNGNSGYLDCVQMNKDEEWWA